MSIASGKGIGEVPIVPVAAAIANALEDATGVRLKDLPLTPEKSCGLVEAGIRYPQIPPAPEFTLSG